MFNMAASVRACFALRFSLGGASPLQAIGGGIPCGFIQRTLLQPVRHGSFFNKLTAEELWKGVLAESGSGAKKGRGKRTKRKLKADLSRGVNIGEGKGGFLWPGLNTPVFRSGSLQAISRRGDAEQQEVQAEIETYDDFDSRVIEVKAVFNMTAKEGRKRSISCLVAVGNGNGAAGFALGKAADRQTALRKDMYCKVEGSANLLNLTRALFTGLANQETHQTLADRKRLNVVEFQAERGPLPLVVARPEGGALLDPEPEDDLPDTRLHWDDVRVAQGSKRSVWSTVKRTIW
ncbi:hypothetical protein NHX12_023001 [Muraenolepis orangiensis]|uniref:Small ribosomal subunit protein uS5m n=1 Tax=Muraenolepis orangiensis TaxID=630683 RepID=A0A9Q0EPN7_9TELE|nr:hypothetical protein NHX12_023001 [Muraenolepis orangiensis]